MGEMAAAEALVGDLPRWVTQLGEEMTTTETGGPTLSTFEDTTEGTDLMSEGTIARNHADRDGTTDGPRIREEDGAAQERKSLLSRLNILTTPWGTFFSIMGVVLGVYFYSSQNKPPGLLYEVLSDATVLDVKEDVPNLRVSFDGEDIKESGQTLRVIVVRVVNRSSRGVRKNDYDEKAPLGIALSSGRIVKYATLSSSNEYLRTQISQASVAQSQIEFPSLIINSGDFFVIKVLVLCSQNESPFPTATGRIADIASIPVLRLDEDAERVHLLAQAFNGGIAAQTLRFVVYPLGLVLLLLAALALGVNVVVQGGRLKRRWVVAKFRQGLQGKPSRVVEWLLTDYIRSGPGYAIAVCRCLESMPITLRIFLRDNQLLPRIGIGSRSMQSGFYNVRDGRIYAKPKDKDMVVAFVEFLRRKGDLTKHHIEMLSYLGRNIAFDDILWSVPDCPQMSARLSMLIRHHDSSSASEGPVVCVRVPSPAVPMFLRLAEIHGIDVVDQKDDPDEHQLFSLEVRDGKVLERVESILHEAVSSTCANEALVAEGDSSASVVGGEGTLLSSSQRRWTMPEKNVQICGKSFAVDYIKDGPGYECHLTGYGNPSIIGNGKGATMEEAYKKAEERVNKQLGK